ncbi:hypothetical protein [Ruegeria lacuscaerulensis]|uniref:hypothetical protein n=1 Tax=Ruegeria lacuscaerulensis TaxID=55218 RepID=UPI00147B8770|nr:hypothetical protein [Ruegeria lacuscaerulensis]
MRNDIKSLIDLTEGVVTERSFSALGPLSEKNLNARMNCDKASGRMPAMAARHHALMAKAALDAEDTDKAGFHLRQAQGHWISALSANTDPRKMIRLSRMPGRAGARPKEVTERLFFIATQLMLTGISKMEALRRAVATDAALCAEWGASPDDTLKKAFKRAEKRLRETGN